MKKKTILIFFLSVAGIGLLALAGTKLLQSTDAPTAPPLPEIKDEYARLINRYLNDSVVFVSGNIKLFDGANMDIVKEESNFVFYKHGITYYSQLSSQQNFSNGSTVVQLDTVNQILLAAHQKDANPIPANNLLSFDRFFSDTASMKLSGEVMENGRYRDMVLQSDFSPGIKQYTITYDPQNYNIKQTRIVWVKNANSGDTSSQNEWIATVQVNAPSKKLIDVNGLINRTIKNTNNKITPTPAFSAYRFRAVD